MEMNEISRLASHLRHEGDTILNASTRLTLSTQLLQKLNELFPLIVENGDYNGPAAFRVINTNNSKFEIYHDLAFLHDFIQKTVGLKITNTPAGTMHSKDLADIKRFGILQSLEVNKVSVEDVSGIQSVQSHLDTIVCVRCLQKLEDILKYCGGDRSSGFVWSELRKAVFSYNGLESLDLSLSYVPLLQTLDLSHNRLSNVDPINCLPNLKCLNLSYNVLQRLPIFNKEAMHKLLVLVVKFNYLEDLSEASCLVSLSELDLSCNCLTDHEVTLRPLLNLCSLSWLSLEGNPLSYHRKHRLLTAQCLHNNITNVKFLLNGVSLSKSERLAVGTLPPVRPTQRFLSSQSSENSAVSEVVGDQCVVEHVTRPQKASRRLGKVREARISEQCEIDQKEEELYSASYIANSLETSMEHLETKKQIETLREKFGEENWLHSRGGSCVQNILGLPQPPKPASISVTSSPAQCDDVGSLMHQQMLRGLRSGESAASTEVVASAGLEPVEVVDDVAAVEQDMNTSVDSIFGSKEMSPAPDNDDSQDEDDSEVEEQVYAVQRATSGIDGSRTELFLVLTQLLIKEKEMSFGRTQQKWSVDSLLSCVRVGSEPVSVQLTFDTVRRDRQERTYIMEEEDAQNLVKTLVGVLESRSLSAMHQTVFRCLNCSSQFSREMNPWSVASPADTRCPNCDSTLVIQGDDTSPVPAGDQRKANANRTLDAREDSPRLVRSSSQSSIGAVGSLGRLLQVTAIVHRHSDDTPRDTCSSVTARSAASLDQSPEMSPNGAGDMGSVLRCDSDIEVISNPSQSSIEVLDDSGTPIRKRSEERQMDSAMAGRCGPDGRTHFLALVGLTESSSSGSFTDSVCTTYENRSYTMGQQRGSFNHLNDEREDSTISEENEHTDVMIKSSEVIDSGTGRSVKDSESSTETLEDTVPPKNGPPVVHSPGNNFTAVLEGLLQNVVSSKNTQSPPKFSSSPVQETPPLFVNGVRYSYSDFAQVDHRVKLHLYLHVFKEEQEQLTLLVRANVLQQSNSSTQLVCIVFSTHKVYILKVTGPEGDDPELWLKKTEALPLNRLMVVHALPWNQGVCLTFKPVNETSIPSNFLILLQDYARTRNLITFLKGISLPKDCIHKNLSVPAIDEAIHSVNSAEESEPSCTHLLIFNQVKIACDPNPAQHSSGGVIIVSKSDLLLSMDNLLWLFPESIRKLKIDRSQKLSNLIEVEVAGCSLTLHFLDEVTDQDETWTVALETVGSVQEFVAAIKAPWEELFLVPLQILYTSQTELS